MRVERSRAKCKNLNQRVVKLKHKKLSARGRKRANTWSVLLSPEPNDKMVNVPGLYLG
jgi:hypothetical protein